ncbi:MAG: FeoA family protein [Chloroflexi bacterium]|nr:FeoA family protein [Chloroflexota bacterium]
MYESAGSHFLTDLPIGRQAVVSAIHLVGPESSRALLVRTQAMGLHIGSCVEVLRRNGRLLLLQIGAVQMAVSSDFARAVEVQ